MKTTQRKCCRAAALGILLLAGCTTGPDFQRPALPQVAAYTPATPATELTDASTNRQTIVAWEEPATNWWHTLNNEKLDMLVVLGLANNPALLAAEARVRQARELYQARAGSTRYPQVEGNIGAQRQRFNPVALEQGGAAREFSLYNVGLGVRYNFDLAGGNRRALEALAARSDYQEYQLQGARLTLVADIVITTISQASLRHQIEIVENIVQSQQSQLELTRERIRLGQGTPDDDLAQQTQLAQTCALLPPLRLQLQQNEHLLATLVGQAPGASALPHFTLQDFTLPATLPLLVPSELVRVRPDILGTEALLHAANAEYGVAIAKLYPQLNLGANLGTQALTIGSLFGSGSAIWSLVGQLTQPLFDKGLPAEKRAALAAFDAAAANYQVVVLEALRSVADILRALENDTRRLDALQAADTAAQQYLQSVERQHQLGTATYHDLLLAHQKRLETELQLTEAKTKRLLNTALFHQAMGSGTSSIE